MLHTTNKNVHPLSMLDVRYLAEIRSDRVFSMGKLVAGNASTYNINTKYEFKCNTESLKNVIYDVCKHVPL